MEIRKIIILGAFALLSLSVSCSKEPESSGNGGGNETISGNIQGTVVSSTGTPLAGVVVSDGLHCTKTDSKGRFGLQADLDNTDYVFVSTPKDYSAPIVDGAPVFWKFLSELKAVNGKYTDVTFTLNKISDPERFTMLIYADPQPRSKTATYDKLAYHSLECCDDMYKDMKEVVQSITDRPVYGIGLGDIVHRDLTLLPKHKKGMASTGLANYNVIGNHDHDVSKTTNDRDAARPFEAVLGPCNYSFDLGDMHFLVLDNMIAPLVNGKISDGCDDGLTDEIWQWMQNDLSYVPTDKTIMLCAHSPMFRLQSGSDRTTAKHYGDYKALLHHYKKVLAWAGHTHSTLNYVNTSDPVIETHTVSRVTGELWTNEYLGANGTPRGYIVFDYDNGNYSWKFKPIFYQSGTFVGSVSAPGYVYRDWDYENGKAVMRTSGKALDDKYQMQIFAPGSYGDSYLYVNVFLWDELWELPKFTMGGIPVKMSRVNTAGYKYSLSNYEINDYYLNAYSSLASSGYSKSTDNANSIFRIFVEDEHGTGTVSVVDRFGKTHSQTITW